MRHGKSENDRRRRKRHHENGVRDRDELSPTPKRSNHRNFSKPRETSMRRRKFKFLRRYSAASKDIASSDALSTLSNAGLAPFAKRPKSERPSARAPFQVAIFMNSQAGTSG